MKKRMIKPVISLALSVLLLLSSFSASLAAGPVDLSKIRGNDLYEISVSKEDECAYIDSTLSTAQRSFNHKNENDYLYSDTEFDILVLDYFKDAYPVFRLWIHYTADDFLYITGVTFVVDGKKYTFSGISSSDRLTELDNGVMESLVIKFGRENSQFLLKLYDMYTLDDLLAEDNDKEVHIPMILHGIDDVEVTLDSWFMLDFLTMFLAFAQMHGQDYWDKVSSTAMKITG